MKKDGETSVWSRKNSDRQYKHSADYTLTMSYINEFSINNHGVQIVKQDYDSDHEHTLVVAEFGAAQRAPLERLGTVKTKVQPLLCVQFMISVYYSLPPTQHPRTSAAIKHGDIPAELYVQSKPSVHVASVRKPLSPAVLTSTRGCNDVDRGICLSLLMICRLMGSKCRSQEQYTIPEILTNVLEKPRAAVCYAGVYGYHYDTHIDSYLILTGSMRSYVRLQLMMRIIDFLILGANRGEWHESNLGFDIIMIRCNQLS